MLLAYSIFDLADGFLCVAFAFLHFTFRLHLGAAGGFADALLDVTGYFVCCAFHFVFSATHDDSPNEIEVSSIDIGLTARQAGEFQFLLPPFIGAPEKIVRGFIFKGFATRIGRSSGMCPCVISLQVFHEAR
jgi:thiamine pyrophosphokinase